MFFGKMPFSKNVICCILEEVPDGFNPVRHFGGNIALLVGLISVGKLISNTFISNLLNVLVSSTTTNSNPAVYLVNFYPFCRVNLLQQS